MPAGTDGSTNTVAILGSAELDWVFGVEHVARMLSVGAKADEPNIELVFLLRRGTATTSDLQKCECTRKKGRYVAVYTLDVTEAPSTGLIWWLAAKVCGTLLTLAEEDGLPLPSNSFLPRLGPDWRGGEPPRTGSGETPPSVEAAAVAVAVGQDVLSAVQEAWDVDEDGAAEIIDASETLWDVLERHGGVDAWGGREFEAVFPEALKFIWQRCNGVQQPPQRIGPDLRDAEQHQAFTGGRRYRRAR